MSRRILKRFDFINFRLKESITIRPQLSRVDRTENKAAATRVQRAASLPTRPRGRPSRTPVYFGSRRMILGVLTITVHHCFSVTSMSCRLFP